MSNSLDRDQAQPFVGPDLGPNCLQRLNLRFQKNSFWNTIRVSNSLDPE